jgi:GNAT superfamily N-acetyltransferase
VSGVSDVRQLEAAVISAWPSITSAMDGSWLARFARGYTKRSNSVQCLDVTDDSGAAARLQRMVDLFLLNDREPIFRVTPLAGQGVIAALDAAGWESFEESRVLAMPLDADFGELAPVRIFDATDRNWLEAFAALSGIDRRSQETLGLIVGLIAHRQAGVLVRDATGDPAAAALAVDAAGTGVYHNVVVRPDLRGRGLGRATMHAALNWTREVGSIRAAIQVVSANVAAVNLYASLGFEEAYRYHYRRSR